MTKTTPLRALLCFGLDHTQCALKATRLGNKRAIREPLELELAAVWWILFPAADAALIDAESRSNCGLRPVVRGHV